MLSGAELTSMREDLDLSLPDACVISRRSLTTDGQGGSTESWSAAGTVFCRVSPAGVQSGEVERASRVAAVAEWTVTLPYSTDVRPADRLVVNSVTYEPVGVKAPRSWELSRKVTCKVIQ